MSTYYEILQVSETASPDIIKQRFQQLILKHHPDKSTNNDKNSLTHNILKAWEILRNPTSRKEYDIELQRQRNKKDVAIGAEVDLDDMEYNAAEGSYSLVCRCSGDYVITEDELETGIDVVGYEDLVETFVKGSGPGGQCINKRSSCVDLRHIPTGIRVQCQQSRSLADNRGIARKLLREKLDELINGKQSKNGQKAAKIAKQKARRAKRAKEKYGNPQQKSMGDTTPTATNFLQEQVKEGL
ncbi:hypothetical protein [Parasitella parasitica]|uniref:Diphthamide biosynthesis protein 4 n=1 Tax=Parasitella parasitica TaxID=35722 RepID=A0A0B7NIY3_9FUNG|nr:hypothetical protein [Parasitella parasitica]